MSYKKEKTRDDNNLRGNKYAIKKNSNPKL